MLNLTHLSRAVYKQNAKYINRHIAAKANVHKADI